MLQIAAGGGGLYTHRIDRIENWMSAIQKLAHECHLASRGMWCPSGLGLGCSKGQQQHLWPRLALKKKVVLPHDVRALTTGL